MSPVGRVTTDRGAGAEQRRCAAGEGDAKGLGYGAWQAPHLGQLGAVVRRRLGSILHLAVLVADDREAILVLVLLLLLLPRCLFVLILVLLFLLVAVLLATVFLLAVLLLLLLLLLLLPLLLRLRGGNVSEGERVVVAVPANPRKYYVGGRCLLFGILLAATLVTLLLFLVGSALLRCFRIAFRSPRSTPSRRC